MQAVSGYGPVLVGGALLLAGLIKALDAMAFVLHLTRFPGLPFRLARVAGPLLLVGECALATALVVGLWPRWTQAAAIALLLFFAAVLAWGWVRADAEDCGCYGGLIRITLPQSLALDGAYVVLVALGWRAADEVPDPGAGWKVVACVGIAGLAAVLSTVSWFYVRKKGRPLITWNRLREGAAWRSPWLGHPTRYRLESGEHLVAFLSMECSKCRDWMGLLRNAVDPRPELPDVLGVLDLPEEKLAELREILGFPLAAVSALSLRRLTWTLPFGVLVEDGIVREVWADVVPESFLQRILETNPAEPEPDR